MKTRFGRISGVRLLAILDAEILRLISNPDDENKERCHYWIRMSGVLAVTGNVRRPTRVPIRVPMTNQVLVAGNPSQRFSERVHFPVSYGSSPKPDLNYEQIAQHLTMILSTTTLTDRDIAIDLLQRMMGGPTLLDFRQDRAHGAFFDALVVLMFGVEASRNQATLATSVFLLDLIRSGCTYGRKGTKRFTFAKAFHSRYYWDDGLLTDGRFKGSWYGGKFPMAVHGTGPGNMRRRYEIVGAPGSASNQEALEYLTQRHAVPQREIALLVHWLEASGAEDTAESVEECIRTRLHHAFVSGTLPQALPQNPRPDTGEHVKLDSLSVDGDQKVFVVPGPAARHYHLDPACKTVPGKFRTHHSLHSREGGGIQFPRKTLPSLELCSREDAEEEGLTACPWCFDVERRENGDVEDQSVSLSSSSSSGGGRDGSQF